MYRHAEWGRTSKSPPMIRLAVDTRSEAGPDVTVLTQSVIIYIRSIDRDIEILYILAHQRY